MKLTATILILGLILALGLTGCQSVYVTSAKVYLQQNDLENAKKQLQEGLAINPKDAEAHYLLGQIYAQEENYPEMMKEFEASLALSQKFQGDIDTIKERHFRSTFNAAVDAFNNGQPENAVESLKKSILIHPDSHEAWSLLGKSYVRLQDHEQAVQAMSKAIELDHNWENMDDRILLMEMLYNNKKYGEALQLAESLLQKDPANKDGIKVAAYVYNQYAMEETDEAKKKELQNKAIEYYERVLQDSPDDANLVFNLGLLYEDMGEFDQAIARFDRAAALNPNDLEALLHVAELYLQKMDNSHKAIEYYQKALTVDPDNAGILNNLGVAQMRVGVSEENQEMIEEGKKNIARATELRGSNQ
ncbi:MAG: tetratricopeptide repeat protein [Candidatus Zixiibacteriota bacterium]|nr:MAG: tetratricopeptide repeat protein [candidate division Zixibacteria bacterium]